MKVQTVLYYRYLSNQTFILLLIYFFVALFACLLFLFANILDKPFSYIIAGLVWLLPLLSLCSFLNWFYKYKKFKKIFNNDEYLDRFKNSVLREKVLKSGMKIKYIFPKKHQEDNFFKAIEPEIIKQKKLLNIIKERENK